MEKKTNIIPGLGLWLYIGISACLLLLASIFAYSHYTRAAAPPTTMNFQGRLASSSGNVVADGQYNMQFRIYSVASGGTALWSETRQGANRVQVTNGLFSVQLGAVTPLNPATFDATNLYFEITMATPATATTSGTPAWESAMTPRNKLATSAYAFNATNAQNAVNATNATNAQNANTLDGLDSTAFASASGSSSYIQNTTSPQTASFNVTGSGRVGGTLTLGADVSLSRGATNRLDLASGDSFNLVNGNLMSAGVTRMTSAGLLQNVTFADAGAFFTGGTISNARLTNSGALTVTAGSGLTGGGSVALGGSTTINVGTNSITDSHLQYDTGQHLTTSSAPTFGGLTISSDNGLSFGGSYKLHQRSYSVTTAAPATLLDAQGSPLDVNKSYEIEAVVSSTGTKTGARVYFYGNGTTFELYKMYEAGTTSNHIEFFLDAGVPKVRNYDHTSSYTVSALTKEIPNSGRVAGAQMHMYADVAGNIGIGTTNPTSALQVNGTVTANQFSGNGAALTSLNASNISSGTLNDARLSSNVARLSASQTYTGTMTMGSTNSTGKFVVQNSGGSSVLAVDTTNQRVGVNKAAPGEALDVVGNIGLTGQLISAVSTGTAPFQISSSTKVVNLNADLLDGKSAEDFVAREAHSTSIATTGWYRIASNGPVAQGASGGTRATGKFVVNDMASGRHSTTTFYASYNFGNNPTITLLHRSSYGSEGVIKAARIVEGSTYEGAAVEVYIDNGGTSAPVSFAMVENEQTSGWTTHNFIAGSQPAGFAATQFNFDSTGAIIGVAANGSSDVYGVTRDGDINTTGEISIQGTGTSSIAGGLSVGGNLSVAGTISGSGAGITSLNASNLSTGTVSDSRLSSNIATLASSQTFTGAKTFNAAVAIQGSNSLSLGGDVTLSRGTTNRLDLATGDSLNLVSGNLQIAGTTRISSAGAFTGSGAGITSLNGTNISSGTIADARLSTNVALLSASQTFTGTKSFDASVVLNGGLTISSNSLITNLNADTVDGLHANAFGRLATNNSWTGFNTFGSVDFNNAVMFNGDAQFDGTTTMTGGLNLNSGKYTQQSSNAAAFTIQNISSQPLFIADTMNMRVHIGSKTADSTGVVLVLDTKNTAGDPTGMNGAMYYNSNLGKFRCFEAGAWKDCGGGAAGSKNITITSGARSLPSFSSSTTVTTGVMADLSANTEFRFGYSTGSAITLCSSSGQMNISARYSIDSGSTWQALGSGAVVSSGNYTSSWQSIPALAQDDTVHFGYYIFCDTGTMSGSISDFTIEVR